MRVCPLFQVVIPESRSRESVVSVVVALFHNNRSPTETLGDDTQSGTVVIPECRSRESVVSVVVALFHNNRSPTETLGDDTQSGLVVIS